jgi:predicted permease
MLLVIGTGIGAATAIFSVLDTTMLRPPPFAEPDRLVQVMDVYRSAGARSTSLTLQKIAGWQQQRALFEAFEGHAFRQFDLTAVGIDPERVSGLVVTNGLLRMLGAAPSLGRGFLEDDGAAGAEPVVLISEGLWKRRFGGRPDILGTRVDLSGERYTVVGTMPRRFRVGSPDEDVWLPVDVDRPAPSASSPVLRLTGLARISAGVDPATRQTQADAIAAWLQREQPLPAEPFWDIHLEPKRVAAVTPATRTALFVLLGAVGVLLLITCANTAALMLSDVEARRRDVAIRAAIGASRARLFGEHLVESLLLAGGGGALGVLIAFWGVEAIVAAAPPNLAHSATRPIEVDLRVLGMAAWTTVATGLVFGLLPAVRGSAPDVERVLKMGGRGGTRRAALPSLLVVAEVAFSLVLLVGAALMIRTFANLHAVERGFDGQGVVAVGVSLPTDRYNGAAARSAFFADLRERLQAQPGISGLAFAAQAFGGAGITFADAGNVEGRGSGAAAGPMRIPSNTVSADYFAVLGIPLVEGRTFTPADGTDAVVVSRSFAQRLWPDGRAVGRSFRLASGWPWQTVVGIAGDVAARAVPGDSPLQLYQPFPPPGPADGDAPRARGFVDRVVLVRASAGEAAVPAVRAAVRAIDPHQPLGKVQLVSDLYGDVFGRERFVLQLMVAFGAIAVLLTAAGIFGLVSHGAAARTREIGLRVALGAPAASIVALVSRRTTVLVGLGTVVGLAAAAALSRFLEALLFGVRPLDPVSYAVVAALMGAVAALACWLPTRRALRVDPAVALRVE